VSDLYTCHCSRCGKAIHEVALREDASTMAILFRVHVVGWTKLVAHWCTEGMHALRLA
jgi:hypothetical protein